MPTIFKLMKYRFYFWSNEGVPTEPVHIHFSEGNPSANSPKIWILKNGDVEIDDHDLININKSDINRILAAVRDNRQLIIDEWLGRFGEIRYRDEI